MSNRIFTQSFCVVGAILEKDGKILLVKEAGTFDKGKWSHPAGWLDPGEIPIDAAKREVLKESGYKVEFTNLLGIYSLVRSDKTEQLGATPHAVKLIYRTELLNDKPQALTDEITATKWFTPEEVYAMDINTLRDMDIKQMVKDYFAGQEYPLSIVKHTVQRP